jgi:hypothetical protein
MTSRLRVKILDRPDFPFLYFDDLSTSSDVIDEIILEKYGKKSNPNGKSRKIPYTWTSEIVQTEDKLLSLKIDNYKWKEQYLSERAENVELRKKIRSLEVKVKHALAKQYYLEDKLKIDDTEKYWRKNKPSTDYYKRAWDEIGEMEFVEKEFLEKGFEKEDLTAEAPQQSGQPS